MALQFKLQLVVVTNDDQQVSVDELVVLNKDHERPEHLGLTLAEAKALLLELQWQVLNRRLAAFLASRAPCPTCGRRRGVKDHKAIVFRTLFGKLRLASPRLRRCPCQHGGPASSSPLVELLPEHTAPELQYLESKWASLVSDGLTVTALAGLVARRRDAEHNVCSSGHLVVARRLESELGPEPRFPLAGCSDECPSLPAPPAPITVGIDGGYLRHWERKQAHFSGDRGRGGPGRRSRQALRLRPEPRPEAAAAPG